MYFPKSYTIGGVGLALILFLGLLIFVYFQGGVERAIHLLR